MDYHRNTARSMFVVSSADHADIPSLLLTPLMWTPKRY
jgi:hypothetical protein